MSIHPCRVALVLATLVGISSSAAAGPEAVELERGPYLQLATDSGMTVRWRTSEPTRSELHYGPGPGELDTALRDDELREDHEIRIEGLEPSSRYYYSVGFDGHPLAGFMDHVHYFTTPPRPGTAVPTRVWVLGDSGTRAAEPSFGGYLDFSLGSSPDVWLMLGDNAYPAGTDWDYQRTLFHVFEPMMRSTVLWPATGNHDLWFADAETESGPYFDIFTLPRAGEAGGVPSGTEAYYSFDHGDVHFVCLDSDETPREAGSAMMRWLERDLSETARRWIIVYFHHAPYTMGGHESDDGRKMTGMREDVVPVLEAAGVDLVLAGHSHVYERSFFLDGHHGDSDTFDASAHLVQEGDGRVAGDGPYLKVAGDDERGRGAVYVVLGSSAGATDFEGEHPAMAVALSVQGSLVIDIAGDRLDSRFVDTHGAVLDHFTILKRAATR